MAGRGGNGGSCSSGFRIIKLLSNGTFWEGSSGNVEGESDIKEGWRQEIIQHTILNRQGSSIRHHLCVAQPT
ncbi:Signal Transducer And Activator Of Transcription 5A [Manis pentadactyla]|nr:Signal Transducer And Activator Of Transcription 5A [Manis pentadactyla]